MNAPLPMALLDRRFLILSGKGGVGRTTVAAALARLAARTGKRVLLAQMDSPERLGRLFGRERPIGPHVEDLGGGLSAVNMTAREALHEYGLMVLRYESIYRAVFENRAARGFLSAIPGLDAYAMLGKAWWHTTEAAGPARYDLVIVDGPASGHTSTMLKIPQAILGAVPKGPLSKDASAIQALLTDPRQTAFVIVTLAEELPARETAQLARTVQQELRLPLGPLIVNAVPDERWGAPPLAALLDALGDGGGDAGLGQTLRGASLLARRRHEAAQVLLALRETPGLPTVVLPRLPTTDLGPDELEVLLGALAGRV